MASPANRQIPEYLDNVGRGWRAILTRAHTELVDVLPNYKVSQIKQKYGTLRIHLLPYRDPVSGEFGIAATTPAPRARLPGQRDRGRRRGRVRAHLRGLRRTGQ